MKAFCLLCYALLYALAPVLQADEAGAAANAPAPSVVADGRVATEAAAAVVSGNAAAPSAPDFLEHLVDVVLELFNVKNSGNTPTHYVIAALFLVGSFLLRRVVTTIFFALLRRWTARTQTTLDDKLLPALEAPVATLITVAGAVAALRVLKLTETSDSVVGYASTVAFSLTFFWLLLRAFNALLEHAQEVAVRRQMGIAAFMPWIKKSLVVVFVAFGVLMIAQSLGADVKAFLAGLGLGGLAFALAAQDTLANVFGSVVVAIDQPFKIGEYVKVGAHEGTVEDIGLRSTRLRTPARTLITVPNKTMASETINNFSRMPQRRVDQMLGLTYDTTPAQLEAILSDLRALLRNDPGVHQELVAVYFSNYGASSLDLQMVYFTTDANWARHMEVRERLNLAIMKAVAARGLAFAFPTQTIQLDGEIARRLAAKNTHGTS